MHWSDSASDVQSSSDNVWDGYVGVWHMNETGTTAEPDSTGNGLDATPLNTSDAATNIDTGTGVVGTGRVNANNKHLTVGSSTKSYWGDGRLKDKTKFSISGWFQWATDSTHPRLVSACTSGSDLNAWEILYLGNSGAGKVLRVRSGDGSGNNEAYFANTSIPLAGSYVYLTVVWDGANVSVYKDGAAQTKTDGSARSNSTHKDKFEIGGFGNTGDRSFIGKFDEVRMYNGALSADRIAADYATMNDPTAFLTLVPATQGASVDYFVEWVQPSSANLYVDTGVQGKVGVKAELQYIHVQSVTYPVMLGSWGGNNKRFNLAMHWGEQARWEYGNQMNDLGAITRYGVGCTVEVVVPTDGKMSCTWTTTRGDRITPTMDATATYGLLDTATTLYLFASHYKDASSDTANQPHAGRLYYCKLWEGDTGAWTLARNFRPCVKDGVAGLYDYVTGEVHYPVSSVANCVLVAGPVAYDRIATWNGGATPTAAELGTAANWSCTDKSGASVASAVPDKATLVVFPSGIGSVTLPAGYTAPWGAVSAEGGVAHPATQYGTCGNSRNNVILPAYRYTAVGEGSLSDLVKVNGATSALNYQGKQVRHDGWFYVNAAQAGTWTINQDVDDYFGFYIDDRPILFNWTYNPGISGLTCEVTEGWHKFNTIVGDTSGGWGMEYKFGNDYVPFTITVNGNTYVISDDTTFPKGSGTSTITLTADANWSALGKVALQGGAKIDLNGYTLVVDDILADDYIGTVITNSAAKKSVLYFLGDPLESKAYATGIIKEANEKIILAHDGDQVATWTGAANDGNPATAGNWEDLAGQPVVPTAAYAVKRALREPTSPARRSRSATARSRRTVTGAGFPRRRRSKVRRTSTGMSSSSTTSLPCQGRRSPAATARSWSSWSMSPPRLQTSTSTPTSRTSTTSRSPAARRFVSSRRTAMVLSR